MLDGQARMLARVRGTPARSQVQTLIGRYVLHERLGSGAIGFVQAAFDPELGRRVAIKLLRSAPSDTSQRERLRREAQSLARLSHPNVVQVYDCLLYTS
ncbi:MAG: protein kinase, partial [Nannocystaceae bacterium]|nr:protein kinase [Nannocystaceae bacterium]